MTDTSVIITMLEPSLNKQITKSIKNIRPDAPADKILLWTKTLVQVTDNTYVGTSIIHKIPLD